MRTQDVVDVFGAASLAIGQRQIETYAWAAAENQAKTAATSRTSPVASLNAPVSAAAPSSLSDVMQCIKDHESGNYAESSHPSSGSGAFQYVPGTWAEWSVRAGYGTRDEKGRPLPTYHYAYQAPPDVQDAVTVHVLTHGGAGNWSPRYGDDPCTVGMGG